MKIQQEQNRPDFPSSSFVTWSRLEIKWEKNKYNNFKYDNAYTF